MLGILDADRHYRHSIRLRDYDYTRVGAYFITICTYERACLLGAVLGGMLVPSQAGRVVDRVWSALPQRFPRVEIDAFVVMPNHIHGVLMFRSLPDAAQEDHAPQASRAPAGKALGAPAGSLGAVVGAFKASTARRINAVRRTPGAPVWQRNFYDHVVRGDEDLARVRRYIDQNPLRWEQDEHHPAR